LKGAGAEVYLEVDVALVFALEFAEALVFRVVVDFGSRGPTDNFREGNGVFTLEADLEEDVTFFPLAGCITCFCLAD